MMEPPIESERFVPPPPSGPPTLLDDWYARCRALEQVADATSPRDYAETELRILRFLIVRYARTAEGLAPAQFPLKSGHFYFSRAYCIEQRIRELTGETPQKPKSEQEARARVSGVLKRFAQRDATPAHFGEPTEKSKSPQVLLPEESDQSVVAKSVLEWKKGCYRELCDRISQIRVSATYRLAHCGTLDDIALFSDLLKIPEQASADPVERPMLLWAIKVIAIRHSGETYIPGVSDGEATAPSSSSSS